MRAERELLADRVVELGDAVAERGDPQRRDRVEVAVAVDVDQLVALGPLDDDRAVVGERRHLREAVPHDGGVTLDPVLCRHRVDSDPQWMDVTQAPAPDPLTLRDRLLAATYRCVERFGLGKTTIDDIVKESGVSRATIYRQFPGGRDELLLETVGLGARQLLQRARRPRARRARPGGAARAGPAYAHRSVAEHAVLRKIIDTEPERLLPLLTTESAKTLPFIADFLLPYLAPGGRGRPAAARRRPRPGRRVPRPVDPVADRRPRPLGPRRTRPGHATSSTSSSSAGSSPANSVGRPSRRTARATRDREHECDALTR